MRATLKRIGTTALAALLLASCATKKVDSAGGGASGGQTGSDGVKTDVGVSKDTIYLGALSDLTGIFAGLSKQVVRGNQMAWEDFNKQGKVCGRTVDMTTYVRDHNYNVQQARGLYTEISPKVLALQHVVGSPVSSSLKTDYTNDKMTVFPVAWASSLLDIDGVVMAGTTYDVEIINGWDWVARNKGLKDGDKIGHIFQEGEYGEGGLAGSKYVAQKHNYQLVEQKITANDKDLTAQVTALKNQGVKFVALTTAPAQTGSAVGVASTSGAGMFFIGSNPALNPGLLQGPAKDALAKDMVLINSAAPFTSDAEGVKKLRDSYKTRYKEPGDSGVTYGYGQAIVMKKILDQACADKDLTRQGLLNAKKKLSNVDTGGLLAKLDYSKQGEIPAKETYVATPDASQEGGLKVTQPLFISKEAESYTRKK